MANKRIQYRAQLAFKPASADHMRVYEYLRDLPDKTDYIVRLVLADLDEKKTVAEGAGPRPSEGIDYAVLAEMLRPMLSGMVKEAMRDVVSVAGSAGTAATPSPPEPEEDLDLAMEGLRAFGL